MDIFFRCELKGRYFKFLCISDVDDSEKPLNMQTSELTKYITYKKYVIETLENEILPEVRDTLMGLERLKAFFPYHNDLLRNMNISTSNKTSIISLIDKSFNSMTKIWDKADFAFLDLAFETFLLNKTVFALLKNFKLNFHSDFSPSTFNQNVFNFYFSHILPFYTIETVFSNTYDNIKEIFKAGES